MKKKRLDMLMAQRNLVESKEKVKVLIMSGIICVNGQKEDKASTPFKGTIRIEIRGSTLKYVNQGGLKLEKVTSCSGVQLTGKVCMNVGAPTGRFMGCMLQDGAAKMYAADVGRGRLAWELRSGDRAICMRKTNIRYVTPEDIGNRIESANIDMPFVSLTKVLEPVKQFLTDEGQIVCLIKPQFEAGRGKVGKKGVVREKSVYPEVIEMVTDYARSTGSGILGLESPPIKGPRGNIKYLLHLQNILQENGGQEDNVQKITGEKAVGREEVSQLRTEYTEMRQTENHQAKRDQTEYELSARVIVEQAHGCLS